MDLDEYDFSDDIRYKKDDVKKIKAIADYQFGYGAGEALFKGIINIEKSKKTGKIRHIYDGKTLIVNMRASDSYLILSKEGARRLHSASEYPQNRVVVNKDSEPFALDGKSVFCKFVTDCDDNIRSNDEVLIVGALFGLTEFCYWLYVTDLGVDRNYERQGIATRLMKTAHEIAGGEKDIAVYLIANEGAVGFYEKIGMKKADEVMKYNHIEWTEWTV